METNKNNLYFLIGGDNSGIDVGRGGKGKVRYFHRFSSKRNNSSYNVVLIDGEKENFAEILAVQPQSDLIRLLRAILGSSQTGERISDNLVAFVKREYNIDVPLDNCLLLNVPRIIDGTVEYRKVEYA